MNPVTAGKLCAGCKHATGRLSQKSSGQIFFCPAKNSQVRSDLVEKCALYDGDGFPVDVAILTATDIETWAVRQWISSDGPQAWERSNRSFGQIYWSFSTLRSVSKPGHGLRCVLAQSGIKGMPAAAVLATKAFQLFRPRVIAMLGITAGRRDKTRLGDVIVPTIVYDYGAGKWDGEEFLPSPHQVNLDERILRKCEVLRDDAKAMEEIALGWKEPLQSHPRVLLGPAASGAAVVNSTRIWSDIQKHNRDVIAIDMEAYAVVLAGQQASSRPPQVLIAKSVCDYGFEKSDAAQAFAAYTSARFFRLYAQKYLL